VKIDTIMGGGLQDAPAEAAAARAAGYDGLADAARELVAAVRVCADELAASVRR
jgi:hypothetical protein